MATGTAQSGDVNPALARTDTVLPSTEALLVSGGDARIALQPVHGVNRYGCRPHPDPGLADFGSSTASTISAHAFAAAGRLRDRLAATLAQEAPAAVYEREIRSVRERLLALCGLEDTAGLDIVFGASGTDLHRVAAQITAAGRGPAPLTAITVETAETGSRVPAALAGTYPACAAQPERAFSAAGGRSHLAATTIMPVAVRTSDGTPRAAEAVNDEFQSLTRQAVARGHRVLLVVADVSKTGLVAPTPACATALRRQYPDRVDVLIDACQFRLAPATLRDYLELDFIVTLTGSKFLGGPTFAGALLVPPRLTERFQRWRPPPPLRCTCSRADWPATWAAATAMAPAANFGLLLRWGAALDELERLRELPEQLVTGIVRDFANAVTARLNRASALRPLPAGDLSRPGLPRRSTFDRIQTIFPFAPLYQNGRHSMTLAADRAQRLYHSLQLDLSDHAVAAGVDRALASERYQLGQPVTVAAGCGKPIHALRLSLGARTIVEAAAGPTQAARIIELALRALDKAEALL